MRNRVDSKIQNILAKASALPYFTIDDLASIETNRTYLKILLSRHEKSGTVFRLKKGTYVTRAYADAIEKSGRVTTYAEFLAGVLYAPSYLSMEYILYQHGIITESPVHITAVSKKKTAAFATRFGTYQYHSIAPKLFCGFSTKRDGDFFIYRASPAKALFDYLYFRKRHIPDERAIEELRLNLDDVGKAERKEFAEYVALEGSARMKYIAEMIFQ
ncbi:MAG: hypothetical protein AAB932_04155 [Patescibacteria group bacterium]